MKRSEYYYLAGKLFEFASSSDGKLSPLIKELITKLNKDKTFEELLLDDVEQNVQSTRSDTEIKQSENYHPSKQDLFGF